MKDGSELRNIHIIVHAIGYDRRFPFLEDIWPSSEQKKCELYNYTISPDNVLDGLGFLMIFSVNAPFFPIGEMQCRWFIYRIVPRSYDEYGHIFNEAERKHMTDIIAQTQMLRQGSNVRFDNIDNPSAFLDHLADEIGALPPDINELIQSRDSFKTELGVALAYGPLIPLQYRIDGPHADAKAAMKYIEITIF